jgi:HD-GYP domain-containing protein (c-di-GMP phosphodiesterase class II)
MKKSVPVSRLRFGVYIHELDRPWTDTPFMFQGFVLNSEKQLETLQKYCKMVVIDTEKGADAQDGASPFASGPNGPSVLATIKEKVTYEEKAVFKSELPVARQIQANANAVVKDIFGAIKAGKALDAPRVREAVTNMTDSVVRNPDAMLLLSRMKEKDEQNLDRALGVSVYMITFGRFLHLPRAQLDLLGMLGLLQDVGKMRLPADLLNKKDPLSEAELEVCKSHVGHSVAILKESVGLPPELSALAALHHERYDGSGYPAGLKAGAIGLYGGIAGVVDCFDALTGPRPYGDAQSPSTALNQLYRWRDSLFDGPLVEQFIQCIGVYSVGTVVELHSGEIGIVIAQNPVMRLLPRVMVVLDASSQPLKPQCIMERASIKRTLPKGSVPIDASEFFL